MNQRLIAAVAAVPLVLGLILAAALMPLPFVVYAPGYTVDVLAKDQNEAEIIQVERPQDLPRRRRAADDHRARHRSRRPRRRCSS